MQSFRSNIVAFCTCHLFCYIVIRFQLVTINSNRSRGVHKIKNLLNLSLELSKLENLCFDTLTLYVSFRSHTHFLPHNHRNEYKRNRIPNTTLPLPRAPLTRPHSDRPTYCTTPHDWCDDTAAVLVGGWLTGCRRLGFSSSGFWARLGTEYAARLVVCWVSRCTRAHTYSHTHENMCGNAVAAVSIVVRWQRRLAMYCTIAVLAPTFHFISRGCFLVAPHTKNRTRQFCTRLLRTIEGVEGCATTRVHDACI